MYPLLKPHREKVEEALRPGFVAITWSSLTIDECKFNHILLFKKYLSF